LGRRDGHQLRMVIADVEGHWASPSVSVTKA